jgi:hypothetical protein
MASNDENNIKHKVEEEAESTVGRKRLWLFDDDGGDDDSSGKSAEEIEEGEEVSLEESSMNHLDTSEEKLLAKRGSDLFFGDDGDTTSPLSEPCTPETPSSHVCVDDPKGSEDDDF